MNGYRIQEPAAYGHFAHRYALPAIIALHVLLLYCWPAAKRAATTGLDAPPLLLRFFSPAPQASLERADPVIPVQVFKLRPGFQAPPVLAPTPDKTPPAADAVSVPVSEAPGAAGPGIDLTSSAMLAIGKVDRELRKEFPGQAQPEPESRQLRLERGIAAAAVQRERSMQERVLPDGRRITKVTGPGYSYCVMAGSVGDHNGMDIMQRGVQTKTTSCGHYFD